MNFFSYFQSPWILLGLLAVPLLLWHYIRKHASSQAAIRFPETGGFKKLPVSWALKARHILPVLRIIALVLLIVALARPRWGEEQVEVTTEGVDIVLALDISGSMRTMDFKPKDRLEVAKNVMADFIQGREHDRMGLVVFASKAFTQCPLTLDHNILLQFLEQARFGLIEDGTAIGTALLTASNRLEGSKAKSRVVILLTDGRSNSGEVSPQIAAKAAQALDIKVYTIGVGKEGTHPIPIDDPVFGRQIRQMPTDIDEETLQQIASETRGRYFRAKDPEMLSEIFSTIDELEKTEIQSNSYTRWHELFGDFLTIGLVLLFLELLLASTRFARIP